MTIEKAAQNLTANKELRLHDLRCAMHKIGASAALISSDESVFWLTGYSGGEAEVIVTPDDALLMTDGRYIEKAKNESAVPAADIMPAKRASVLKAYFEESLLQKICCADDCESSCENSCLAQSCTGGCCHKKIKRTIAVEGDVLSYSRYTELISPLEAQTVDITKQLLSLRSVKTAEEAVMMAKAAKITEDGFYHLLTCIKEGVTELDLAAELTYFFMKRGATHAFSPIIASGENGSMPHAVPTDRAIKRGDMITMDIGAKLWGYCSDFTRTIAIFGVDEEQRTVYNIVRRVQQEAVLSVKAGVSGYSLHAAAADKIAAAGYGLPHGLGHGVGTAIHESPRLSAAAQDVLKAGQIITVEPGIYIPGRMGVRIEDMLLVTEDGAVNFYTAEKELLILE